MSGIKSVQQMEQLASTQVTERSADRPRNCLRANGRLTVSASARHSEQSRFLGAHQWDALTDPLVWRFLTDGSVLSTLAWFWCATASESFKQAQAVRLIKIDRSARITHQRGGIHCWLQRSGEINGSCRLFVTSDSQICVKATKTFVEPSSRRQLM